MDSAMDLTKGDVKKVLIKFAIPYLMAAFLQTFYGMADLYVVGLFDAKDAVSAVSIGSQIMHMVTVIILGIAMGTTVIIGRYVGAKEEKNVSKTIGTSIVFFAIFSVVLMIILLIYTKQVVQVMMTPEEAFAGTEEYLKICFAGIPFIVAYNVISSIYRGMGDSKHPMMFVFIACIANVIIDFIFIGGFDMGAKGAAYGTVIGQAISVIISLFMIGKTGIKVDREDIRIDKEYLKRILSVGIPISLQDGLIQVSFIVITVIANGRGLVVSAAVGIVEKLISFMFLVPSAFLSAISAITAQNIGANTPKRAKQTLLWGLIITMSWGLFCAIYNQFLPQTLVGMFTHESDVIKAGCEYMRSYSMDTFFAAFHFCMSGYFCGAQKSQISFIHNIISIIAVRVPGAYLASKLFPETLYPMGLAAPMGSLLSGIICICFFLYYENKGKNQFAEKNKKSA